MKPTKKNLTITKHPVMLKAVEQDPLTVFGSLGYSNALGALHNGLPGGVKVSQYLKICLSERRNDYFSFFSVLLGGPS